MVAAHHCFNCYSVDGWAATVAVVQRPEADMRSDKGPQAREKKKKSEGWISDR